MKRFAIDDPNAALEYLESVPLPGPPEEFEAVGLAERTVVPDYSIGSDQAVTVGSQIAEFSAKVPTELRAPIANSFLLAQLAANRYVQESDGGTKEWYDRYIEVLANIGWVVESSQESTREIPSKSLKVHEEIIPVLLTALGPTAAATAIVISIMNGLADMNKDQPWITLFQRESQRASANQFQFSRATVDDDETPRISLICFELDASRSITQVLFFKFSATDAKLRHFGAELGINRGVFDRTQNAVQERIAQYVDHYISEIKI